MGLIEFPESLHAQDPTVNTFITDAIKTCAAGDYEKFRLLWIATEQPITKSEFLRGWKATQHVTIEDLKAFRDPKTMEVVYAVRGVVELDPNEVPKPKRDLVLLVVKENNAWHLRKPPRKLVQLLKGGKNANASTNGILDSNGADVTTNG